MSNIISTKVKFVRNLKGIKFETHINSIEQKQVLDLCLNAINDCGMKCVSLTDMSEKVIDNLLARDLLEYEFVSSSDNKACANDGDVTIQVNNKNHIEVLAKAHNIYDAYSKAKNMDKKLCNKLHFAYSDKYGFLAPDIKNIGSGMSVEVKLILPAIAHIGALNKLPTVSDKLIFGINCLDTQSGLCVISTKATLGYTEKQICEITQNYIDKIVKLEIETCKNLSNESDDMEDKVCRAKAILNYCIKLNEIEAYGLLGNILIGINSGIEKDITSDKINKSLNCIKLYKNNFNQLAKEIQKILK
ncbi:MAG: hypothetical protein IJ371_02705 [Clostridia bacterium]|nr:hypothetical protein [Clostridia bacterium]